jgi:hypothetical protein
MNKPWWTRIPPCATHKKLKKMFEYGKIVNDANASSVWNLNGEFQKYKLDVFIEQLLARFVINMGVNLSSIYSFLNFDIHIFKILKFVNHKQLRKKKEAVALVTMGLTPAAALFLVSDSSLNSNPMLLQTKKA